MTWRFHSAAPAEPAPPDEKLPRGSRRSAGERRALSAAASVVAAIVAALLLAPLAQAAGTPRIDATWATSVVATSASLHAEVNPNGFSTTCRFEYITDAAYQANLAANPPREGFAGATRTPATGIGSSSTDQEVLRSVSGLTPNTTYRYRVVGSNSAGASEGEMNGAGEEIAHTFTSEEIAAVFTLPDARGWEMVSPVDKNGGAVQGPGQNFGGDLLQAAAQGGSVTYSSSSSFGEGAEAAAAASQYLGGRGSGGWSAQNVTAPQRSGAEPQAGAGVPYRLFSADLSSALLFSGGSCLAPGIGCANPSPPLPGSGAPAGYQNYYLRDAENGTFQALVTSADAPALRLSAEAFAVSLAGATPDLRHVALSSCAALTANATEATGVGGSCERNLYEWSGGALRLLNLLPGEESDGTPGAALAAQAGAISSEGNRVYFTDEDNVTHDLDLYLREGESTQLVAAGGEFQTASVDGSIALFTKEGNLYRYQAGTETSETLATEVRGVLGASEDGSYIYYAGAGGALFLRHGATTTEVAAAGDAANYPPAIGAARVSADGAHLLFISTAPLTGYDNTDANTKQPDAELYLYTAPTGAGQGALTCVSCNPTNGRPIGPASIPGAIANGEGEAATHSYKPRVLAADASRVFFDSSDALALQDTNNRPDVYEWEAQGEGTCSKPGGCISLISSGRDGEASEFIDASASGADAFFLTAASLVPSDPGSVDLYDAREGGGFAVLPTPIACEGDACQPLPSEPEDPTPGTLVPNPGNAPVHFPKTHHRKPKKNHHKKRHQHKKHKRAAHHSRRGSR
jgi:hypothetical protein